MLLSLALEIYHVSTHSTDLWHRCLGHMNFQSAYHMTKHGLVTGIPTSPLCKRKCTSCILAKHHRERIQKKSTTCFTKIFQLVHSDLCGPVKILSSQKYLVTFIDDYLQFMWVYFLSYKLAYKGETLSKFQDFHAKVKSQFSTLISCLCIGHW